MASQVNSQYAYINLVNGETVWERLRNVRNFLEDRRAAKLGQEASALRKEAKEAKVEEAEATGIRSLILEAKADLIEFNAQSATQEDAYKKLDDELAFLVKYEAELSRIAEETRIEGKTDDEMYQINMESEVYLRNMRKIETEKVALTLGISQATADESMRIPQLRTQLLATSTALSLMSQLNESNKDTLGGKIQELMSKGINLDGMPLSVQEELQLNSLLLIQG